MIKVYNTLTKDYHELKEKELKLFVCGITPQNFAHIGHAKTYVQYDMIVKYLRKRGIKVFYLQNVTDIDDKIIQRAKEENLEPLQLAHKYEAEYKQDIESLGVDSVSQYARATEHMQEVISQVQRLLDKGFAYIIENDGIYFDLSKDKDYGKLSGRTQTQEEDSVSRIDDSINKKNKGDFCVWKFKKENEPSWEAEFTNEGKRVSLPGRPGWHIEDTAISEKYFGPQYDMHGGAIDLIFPHHECEIAQMESISGKKPLVKYWVHTGFLNIQGKKMSKSKGNFLTIKEALEKYDYKLLRYFFIQAQYRSPINFSEELLEQTKNGLERLNETIRKLDPKKEDNKELIETTKKQFYKAMDNDFNTPEAFATIFTFAKELNKEGGGKETLEFFQEINEIFDIFSFQKGIPEEILNLVQKREEARKNKDWDLSDKLRDKIKEKGYALDDSKEKTLVKKL